mgnify:CR=1 FL=1
MPTFWLVRLFLLRSGLLFVVLVVACVFLVEVLAVRFAFALLVV